MSQDMIKVLIMKAISKVGTRESKGWVEICIDLEVEIKRLLDEQRAWHGRIIRRTEITDEGPLYLVEWWAKERIRLAEHIEKQGSY